MTVQKIVNCILMSGAASCLIAGILVKLGEMDVRPLRDVIQLCKRLKWPGVGVFLVFLINLAAFAVIKPSSDGGADDPPPETNAPPVMLCMARPPRLAAPAPNRLFEPAAEYATLEGVGTNETWSFDPPEGASVVAKWRLRGAAEERVALSVPHPVDGPMEIDTFGRIRTEGRTYSPLGLQLGMVPEALWADLGRESRAWCLATASNSTVVCWQNALLNRDTNTPVCVQAEFFSDGRFEFRYDLSSIGEEVTSAAGRIPDVEILAGLAGSVSNAMDEAVTDGLTSTLLWDEFSLRAGTGTNVLYTRTIPIDRKGGWTSYYLSSRGEVWRANGADTVGDWSLVGAAIEWSDDRGASGTLTASPEGDSVFLPISTDATALTITLRSTGGAEGHTSPAIFLLAYTPTITFPGSWEILGGDGNTYYVFTDPDDVTVEVDDTNRPRRAPAEAGEATAADFRMPSGPGVYRLPLADMVEPDAHPPLLMAPRLGAPPPGNPPSGSYLVIVEPWVTYGTEHYGCWHDYPYDWGWAGFWCDCTPDCGCGVEGYSAVDCYIDWYDDYECEAVVEIAGYEVWRDYAYHVVRECDHNYAEDEGYCPCGCDEDCQYCSCMRSDGPSVGSIRFRVGLGTDGDGRKIGFAWFESEGPVQVTQQLFNVDSRPDVYVSEANVGDALHVTTYETSGRDLVISAVSNGVMVAVSHHGAAQPFETWEVTNVSNLNSVVRLVKRDATDTVREDWTYACRAEDGEWVWEPTDNLAHEYVPADPTESEENGTNWVHGVDGRLERLTVAGTNGEEVMIRSFSYDGAGRLVLVDDGTNGCVTIAYDDAGNIAEMTGPEGTLRAAWDANGVMTNLDTSTWNGSVPNPRPLLMAPRPGLLGAPNGGDTIGPGEALDHFLDGTGTPMSMPFSEVDTGWLTPMEFECVRDFIQDCRSPDDYWVSGTRLIATRGRQQYFLGHITVQLDGWITYLGNCNWTFDGTMWAHDDTYDFNAAMRGRFGETLTSIGRWLFSGSGTPFTISFTGSKPLTGSGHCGGK